MEGLGDELRAETDPHERHLVRDEALEQEALVVEPAVPVFLVDVHRAAEDEHRPVVLQGLGRPGLGRDHPLVEHVTAVGHRVREDACGGVGLVDDGKDPHRPQPTR